jgi:uncharacterized protein YyaL (SSP411 family)
VAHPRHPPAVLRRHVLPAARREARDQITKSADAITAELVAALRPTGPGDVPGLAVADDVVAACAARFDARHGGVGTAPKFPSQTPLRLLLRHTARTGRPEAQQMALATLRAMLAGGFHDLLGGGFHRYSVDAQWHVPHFEKLLSDNALLVPALVDAWQLTADPAFADAARATLAFIDETLSRDDGAFGSATDADSAAPGGERVEGWYFTWTPAEVEVELGAAGFSPVETRIVCAAWDINAGGHLDGRSIPRLRFPPKETATRVGRPVEEVLALLARARVVLARARRERPAPIVDTAVLTAWNGYAISAFAFAGFAFHDDALIARAVRAFDAVMASHRAPDGRLWRTRDLSKPTGLPGTLEDHASLCRAALDLYDATGELRFVRAARDLDDVLARHFEDREHGAFFRTADDAEVFLVREKPDEDGAEPSGNALHAENLVRLALLTDDDAFRRRADATMRVFGQRLQRAPLALTAMVSAIELDEAGRELVIALPAGGLDDEGRQLLDVLRRRSIPSRVLLWLRGDDAEAQAMLPPTRGRATTDAVRIFVCEGGACRLPVTTSRDLLLTLGATRDATTARR